MPSIDVKDLARRAVEVPRRVLVGYKTHDVDSIPIAVACPEAGGVVAARVAAGALRRIPRSHRAIIARLAGSITNS